MNRPVPARSLQKESTRRELQAAAFRCFARKGFLATRVAEISREAGVAHGTFYVHFKDKETLVDEALSEFNERLAARLIGAWSQETPSELRELLKRLVNLYFDHLEENRALVEACAERLSGGITLRDARDGINPPVVQAVESLLRELASRTGAAPAGASLLAHGLLAAWLRIGLQMLFRAEVDRGAAEQSLVAMSVGSIEAVLPESGRRFKELIEELKGGPTR